jgi:hypothetical protein
VKFRLLQPAVQELRVAAKYYNDRVPGLGSDFLHEVRESIRRILNRPEAWVALEKIFDVAVHIDFPMESFTPSSETKY